MIITWTVLGFIGDLLTPLFAPTLINPTEAESEAWEGRAILGTNVLNGIQTIAVFGVGAFLLGKRVLIPALLVWVVIAGYALRVLKQIAEPAMPSITYLDIVSYNAAGWISNFVCVFIGVILGELLARRRSRSTDAL